MPRDIYLPLYGRIEHSDHENMAWDLCQTPELSRLRDISLACTPSRFVPHGQAANRFQHSVGVSVLARMLVSNNPELSEVRDLLVAACLLHDAASPPFSHVAEPFLFARTGLHHEQAVAELLADEATLVSSEEELLTEKIDGSQASSLSNNSQARQVLERYSVDPEAVIDVICGRGIYGPLVAGSIDLDNLDNSLHLLISLGFTGRLPYKPKQLVKAFGFQDQQAYINLDENTFQQLLGWRATRGELYSRLGSLVYLASTSMLYRAIELVDGAGYLPDNFFSMDETQALVTLKAAHSGANKLLSSLELWQQYPCHLWNFAGQEDPRVSALYGDVIARRSATDSLAELLSVPTEDLCLYAGRKQGHKAIKLPFHGPQNLTDAALEAFQSTSACQQVAVFIDKRHQLSPDKVQAAFSELLKDLPDGPPSPYFF